MVSLLSLQVNALFLLLWCSFLFLSQPSPLYLVQFLFLFFFLVQFFLPLLWCSVEVDSISCLGWVFTLHLFFCLPAITFCQSHEQFDIFESFINSLIFFICKIGTVIPNFHNCYGNQIRWHMQSIKHSIKQCLLGASSRGKSCNAELPGMIENVSKENCLILDRIRGRS